MWEAAAWPMLMPWIDAAHAITLELTLDGDALSGRPATRPAHQREFSGWLGLRVGDRGAHRPALQQGGPQQ